MSAILWVVPVLVFGMVVAVVTGIVGLFGTEATSRVRLRLATLRGVVDTNEEAAPIRARYLGGLSPVERTLEELPGMERLSTLIKQSGRSTPAYRLVGLVLLLGLFAGVAGWLVLDDIALALLVASVAGSVPVVKMMRDRHVRLLALENQLPDALDLMARSLRAGNPLLDAFRFIGDEMPPPINAEFSRTWSHINYGISLKTAFADMLERAPSISLRAMVTAVLVQRETGGNLAEVLDRISAVLRSRIRFQRRVRTLTAEGRVSASILVLLPFVLGAVISITSPSYLPVLFEDERGQLLVGAGATLMAIGIVWVSRIVRIRL